MPFLLLPNTMIYNLTVLDPTSPLLLLLLHKGVGTTREPQYHFEGILRSLH